MNLKEAFRFQNKLQELSEQVNLLLRGPSNILTIKTTHLRSKVMAEAEDETIVEESNCEYADKITEMANFLMYLLSEREKLSAAIRQAKNALPIDMDSEVSLNTKRQEACKTFRKMDAQRSSEKVTTGGGHGYRFNAEGNQVPYRCDTRTVTSINFDRNVIRRHIRALDKQIDAVSNQLDLCLVNSNVAYDAPFDVNDDLAAVFESYLGG